MKTLKWLYEAAGPAWFRVFLALAIAIFLILVWRLLVLILNAKKEGRSVKVWWLEIGQKPDSTNQALSKPEQVAVKASPAKLEQLEKLVYVKLLHFRDKVTEKPVYVRGLPNGDALDVYDEALYFVFHQYSEVQPFAKWTIRTSGVADPQVLFPWMDQISYADPKDPSFGPNIAVACNTPSNLYIPFTHMFNGQQRGEREVILRTESDIAHARLALDYSSICGFRFSAVQAFRVDKRIPVYEARAGVFCCEGRDLKAGEILKITYSAERENDLRRTQPS